MADTEIKASKSEKTKEHIINTALKLFSEQGFEKTTMRAIAKEAGLSLGASYYHFRSKEELVLAFYQQTADTSAAASSNLIAETKDFKKRFQAILRYKFDQLSQYRHLVKILARHGADFSHPLSPFSKETKAIRDSAIMLIEQAIEGSNFKAHKILRPHLPSLLWLYQMGLILYWANDCSKNQEKTAELTNLSLGMLDKLLKLSSLSVLGPVNKTFAKVIAVVLSGLAMNTSAEGQKRWNK